MLEEARRGLDQQKKDLEGLRNRAVAVLGFAAAVASFAWQQFDGELDDPTKFGLAFAVACGLAAASVLVPRTFTFSLNAKEMDDRIDQDDSIDQMLRDTTLGLHRDRANNQTRLDRMHWQFFSSLLLLGLETASLLIGLK